MQAVDGSARRSPWRVVDVGGKLKSGMYRVAGISKSAYVVEGVSMAGCRSLTISTILVFRRSWV
ncbi:hypothetical protein AAHH78_32820, partial [Burkholderia pseudomallei]